MSSTSKGRSITDHRLKPRVALCMLVHPIPVDMEEAFATSVVEHSRTCTELKKAANSWLQYLGVAPTS